MALLRERSTSRFIADAGLKWSTPPIRKVTTLLQLITLFLFQAKRSFRVMTAQNPEDWSGETQTYSNYSLNIIL